MDTNKLREVLAGQQRRLDFIALMDKIIQHREAELMRAKALRAELVNGLAAAISNA